MRQTRQQSQVKSNKNESADSSVANDVMLTFPRRLQQKTVDTVLLVYRQVLRVATFFRDNIFVHLIPALVFFYAFQYRFNAEHCRLFLFRARTAEPAFLSLSLTSLLGFP